MVAIISGLIGFFLGIISAVVIVVLVMDGEKDDQKRK